MYGKNPKDEAPSSQTRPLRIFEKSGILSKSGKNYWKSEFCYFEKGIHELCQAGTKKMRQIQRLGFFPPTGPQQTNSSLKTGFRSTGYLVVDIS